MNALTATMPADSPIKTGSSLMVTRHPVLTVAGSFLELILPTGWMLSDGAGCQLDVVHGCLWLTDTRGKDLWLNDGDSEILSADTLLTAEYETVLQIRPTETQNYFWQRRLCVNAKHKHMQLQRNALPFWQRCSHLFHLNKLFHAPRQEQTRP